MRRILSLLLICMFLCGLCACSQEHTVVKLKSGSILYCIIEGYQMGSEDAIDMVCEPYTTSDPDIYKNAIPWSDRYELSGMYITQSATPGAILQKDWFTKEKPEKQNDSSRPQTPTTPNRPEQSNVYTLVYSNDGAYLMIDADEILNQIGDDWKSPDKIAAAESAKIEYFAKCTYVDISITEKTDSLISNHLGYNFKANWNLFDEADTVKFYVSSFGLLGKSHYNDYVSEAYYDAIANFTNPQISISGYISYGAGNQTESKHFSLNGQLQFQNRTDDSVLPVTELRLTNTGCEIDIPYDLLLQNAKLTLEELQSANAAERIGLARCEFTLGPALFKMDYSNITIDTNSRPNIVPQIVTYKNMDAYKHNGEVLYQLALNPQNIYAHLTGYYIVDKTEHHYDFYIRCNVVDTRSNKL